MVSLYPNIPHNAGLKVLKDALDCWQNRKIPTDMLAKMTEFVLTNNYFEFWAKSIPSNIWNRYWHEICTTLYVHFYE